MRTTHGAASHRRHSDTPSRDDAVRDEVGSPRHREHRGRAGSEQVQVSVRFQGVKRTRYAQCEIFRVWPNCDIGHAPQHRGDMVRAPQRRLVGAV